MAALPGMGRGWKDPLLQFPRPAAQPGQRRGFTFLRYQCYLLRNERDCADCPADRNVFISLCLIVAVEFARTAVSGCVFAGDLPVAKRDQPVPSRRHGSGWLEPSN